MADIQKQFEAFHAAIRVDYDMASELREKRDAVLKRIRKYLKSKRLPTFRELGQGSYTMKTGTKPIGDLEHDLDVGLRFDFHEGEHTAEEVRGWVYEALKDHTKRIEKKKPCIRVVYEAGYHIDVTSYAVWEETGQDQYRLARRGDGWTKEDPPVLLGLVKAYREQYFADTEDHTTKTDQFRRVVRAVRRRIDVWRPLESKSKPTGLGMVLLAMQQQMMPRKFVDERCDDRRCLATFARQVSDTPGRIAVHKPTGNREDLFGRLSDEDMTAFKAAMSELADALDEAGRTVDPVQACKIVRRVLGDDFPVPEEEDTARRTAAPAIVTSSTSA